MFNSATFLVVPADTSFKLNKLEKDDALSHTRCGNATEFQYYALGQKPKNLTLMKWMLGLIVVGVAAPVLKSFS